MNRLERIILSARHHVTTFTHLLCESAQRDYTALRDQLDNVTPLMAGTENAGLENAGPNLQGEKAGLENTGTSFVWITRHNIITVLR